MKTSESIKTIAPAFLKAQKEIQSVIKDQTNPYFKSKYADLSGVIEACKGQLNEQGIAILQPIHDGTEFSVETILLHESGEWVSSFTPIVVKAPNDPQALGSAITYAKRYGLQSLVLLPAEDDDGNTASMKQEVKPSFPDDSGDIAHSDSTNQDVCPKCGSPMAVSKAGNKYCSKKCWLKGQV